MAFRNRLLIVDDEPATDLLLSRIAASCSYETLTVTNTKAARNSLDGWRPSHILLNLTMPDGDGVEFLRHLSQTTHRPQIVITGELARDVLEAARETAERYGLDVVAAITKPIDADHVPQILRQCMTASAPAPAPVPKGEFEYSICPQEVATALRRGEIEAAYQPIINLKTGQPVAAELLARWHHKDYGNVPPPVFIGALEDHGLAGDLVRTMAEKALEALKITQKAGHDIQFAVNVSAANLTDPRFVDTLFGLCGEAGQVVHRLILEVTEYTALDTAPTTLDSLLRWRLRGADLAIDDFGTGYSSLAQLRKVPLTRMKLDRQFVQTCAHDGVELAIVHSSICLAHRLNKTVVAEGIEDAATLEILRTLGCDFGQGYHIARPMSLAALVSWLESAAGASETAEGSWLRRRPEDNKPESGRPLEAALVGPEFPAREISSGG